MRPPLPVQAVEDVLPPGPLVVLLEGIGKRVQQAGSSGMPVPGLTTSACSQVVFVVISVVLWAAYNRILLPMADRLEQVLHDPRHTCHPFARLCAAPLYACRRKPLYACRSSMLTERVAASTGNRGVCSVLRHRDLW